MNNASREYVMKIQWVIEGSKKRQWGKPLPFSNLLRSYGVGQVFPTHNPQLAGASAEITLLEIASFPDAVTLSEKLTLLGQRSLLGGKVAT